MNAPLPYRLVLDTNVVLDLLHFRDATVLPIRLAIEAGRAQCYASPGTLAELNRVLSYPAFQLTTTAQTALMTQYQAWTNLANHGAAHKKLPRCADPDDQIFLELADAVTADFLISKDKALLALKRSVMGFKIITPAEAARIS